MKIYIASSWSNEFIIVQYAKELRQMGNDVDCFADKSTGRYVFHFSEIGSVEELDAINFLKDKRSKKAFQEDKSKLDWCDLCLLILPAGKSSHLEAGYAVGQGKALVIYHLDKFPKGEFDVMYGFANFMTDELEDLFDYLLKESKNE